MEKVNVYEVVFEDDSGAQKRMLAEGSDMRCALAVCEEFAKLGGAGKGKQVVGIQLKYGDAEASTGKAWRMYIGAVLL